MTNRQLWRGGAIHSPQFPFATAIELTDGIITWIGDEDTADARASDASEIVDCAGGVVLPAFVDAGAFLRPTAARALVEAWPQHGISTGSVLITADDVAAGVPQDLLMLARSRGGHIELVVSDDVALALDLSRDMAPTPVAVQTTRDHAQQVSAARAAGLTVIVDARDLDPDDVAGVEAVAPQQGLHALTWWSGVRWLGDLPELSRQGVQSLTWLVEPFRDASAGLQHGINTVVTLLESDNSFDPWHNIEVATGKEGSWSGRSIIRALSRSAWRVWGDQLSGELAVGQRASMAIWQGSAGADVIAPRGSLAAWSVEAQSGMPVLPVSVAGEGPALTHFVDF